MTARTAGGQAYGGGARVARQRRGCLAGAMVCKGSGMPCLTLRCMAASAPVVVLCRCMQVIGR